MLRRVLVPAVAAGTGFAILISLGLWQLQRREWKHALLAQIARAEASAPLPWPHASVPPPFAKVSISGVWRSGAVGFYGATLREDGGQPVMAASMLQILDRAEGPPLLVDRGVVPVDPAPLPASGPAYVTGYARPAEHAGWLSATDDLAARRFYTLDPAVIGPVMAGGALAPYTLVALGPPGPCAGPAPCPLPETSLPRPPDNHLNYALTWFGLAFSLAAVFAAFLRGAWRAAPRQ